MSKDTGRDPSGQALVSDQAATRLDPSGFDPSREPTYQRGEVFLGRLPHPLRDGSHDVVMCWDAVMRPVRECEGGGWYSYSREAKAWDVRTWMRHKRPPGYAFANGAHEGDADLASVIQRRAAGAAAAYRFRDSDGNPKGGDGTAPSRSDDSAGPKDIAQ